MTYELIIWLKSSLRWLIYLINSDDDDDSDAAPQIFPKLTPFITELAIITDLEALGPIPQNGTWETPRKHLYFNQSLCAWKQSCDNEQNVISCGLTFHWIANEAHKHINPSNPGLFPPPTFYSYALPVIHCLMIS